MDITSFLVYGNTYFGFIIAAMVANLFPLVPEEVFLAGLGYLSASPDVSFFKIYFFVWVGLLITDTGLYFLSRRGSKFISRITRKFISQEYIDKHKEKLLGRMPHIIFISRFIINLRAIGPIITGTTGYPYRKFIKVDMVAVAIYVLMIMGLGHYFKNTIDKILSGSNFVGNIILVVLFTIIFISIIISTKHKIKDYLFGDRLRHFLGIFRMKK